MHHGATIKFCSLTQARRSFLNNEEGQETMRKAGILTPKDIEHWIKEVLEHNIQQKDLANKLGIFFESQSNCWQYNKHNPQYVNFL